VGVVAGRLWRQPEFLKLWIGNSISSVGSQVTVLALPLAAVLIFNAGPAETGMLTAAGVAPNVLVGLFAGAWIDRAPRRPIRVAADLGNALVIASVPAAAVLGVLSLEHLYIATFLAGCCTVFSRLSASAMLPSLVGRENLLEANGKLIMSFSLAQIAGPSLAGVLVQALSAPLALLADAASFVVSAVCVWRVRLAELRAPVEERTSIWHEVVQGLVWLRAEPILFRLTLSIGLANLAWYGVQAVIVVYATRDLDLSPALLGLSLAATGPASLVGAFLAARCSPRCGSGWRRCCLDSSPHCGTSMPIACGRRPRPSVCSAGYRPHRRLSAWAWRQSAPCWLAGSAKLPVCALRCSRRRL
jgi:hypothetical protein